MKDTLLRCDWPGTDVLMIAYHDEEWGVPLHDDRKLFEFMVLDAFQAGLSWKTILHKRESFRRAFDDFDPAVIAKYDDARALALMQDAGIVRNRLKIAATINNAARFLEVQQEYGTFDRYIWQFTDHRTIDAGYRSGQPPTARNTNSDAMSKDLIKRGFKFVGSTICYAFMQAAGMINDHSIECFRH